MQKEFSSLSSIFVNARINIVYKHQVNLAGGSGGKQVDENFTDIMSLNNNILSVNVF